jgi:hypothetical protein
MLVKNTYKTECAIKYYSPTRICFGTAEVPDESIQITEPARSQCLTSWNTERQAYVSVSPIEMDGMKADCFKDEFDLSTRKHYCTDRQCLKAIFGNGRNFIGGSRDNTLF